MSAYLAVDSRVSVRARALVRPVTVEASSSIEARLGITLIDVILAVAASESRETLAGEGVDSIHAGASVEARAVETRDNV